MESKSVRELKKQVNQLEDALIGIATHNYRCKYVYVQDVLDALKKHKIFESKRRRVENG